MLSYVMTTLSVMLVLIVEPESTVPVDVSSSLPRLSVSKAGLSLGCRSATRRSHSLPGWSLRVVCGSIGERAREEGLEFVEKVSLGGLHARLLAQQPQVADDAHLLAYDGPRPRP